MESNSMNTLRTLTAASVIALAMGIPSTSQAFMAGLTDSQVADVHQQVVTTLDQLREEVALGETKTEVMVAKIDAFVKHLDQMLDHGAFDENLVLAAREEAIALRRTIPGIDQYLAQVPVVDPLGTGPVIGERILSEQPVVGGEGGSAPGLGGGFVQNNAGSFGGGGGGGGGFGGVMGGRSGLAILAGTAAAIAIPLATSSDDTPGPIASPSQAN